MQQNCMLPAHAGTPLLPTLHAVAGMSSALCGWRKLARAAHQVYFADSCTGAPHGGRAGGGVEPKPLTVKTFG